MNKFKMVGLVILGLVIAAAVCFSLYVLFQMQRAKYRQQGFSIAVTQLQKSVEQQGQVTISIDGKTMVLVPSEAKK